MTYNRHFLLDDLKRTGKDPSPKQSQDIFNNRSNLSSRITQHQRDTARFLDIAVPSIDIGPAATEIDDGCPEVATLHLPSQIIPQLLLSERTNRVIAHEVHLRCATCVQALQKVRATSILKARLYRTRAKHAKGQVNNTRIQSMVTRMTARIENAVWEYQASRRALMKLSSDTEDKARFQPLQAKEVSQLASILQLDRDLGEGYKSMPWFWSFRAGPDPNSTDGPDNEAEAEGEEGMIPNIFMIPWNDLTDNAFMKHVGSSGFEAESVIDVGRKKNRFSDVKWLLLCLSLTTGTYSGRNARRASMRSLILAMNPTVVDRVQCGSNYAMTHTVGVNTPSR